MTNTMTNHIHLYKMLEEEQVEEEFMEEKNVYFFLIIYFTPTRFWLIAVIREPLMMSGSVIFD